MKDLEIRKKTFATEIAVFKDKYDRTMLNEFYKHWILMNPNGRKMAFEKIRHKGVFHVGGRLAYWKRRGDLNKPKNKMNAGEIIKQQYGL